MTYARQIAASPSQMPAVITGIAVDPTLGTATRVISILKTSADVSRAKVFDVAQSTAAPAELTKTLIIILFVAAALRHGRSHEEVCRGVRSASSLTHRFSALRQN